MLIVDLGECRKTICVSSFSKHLISPFILSLIPSLRQKETERERLRETESKSEIAREGEGERESKIAREDVRE